ncbi:MAG: hypothetical protein K0M49_10205 [Arenimonas sp.]|nr:hypothetical protein [Arenimonas sp.]
MTAFIAFKYEDCIQLLTDGAVYDHQGVLHRIMTKSFASKALPFVVTGRGNLHMVEGICQAASVFCDERGSVDDAVGFLEVAAARAGTRKTDLDKVFAHFEIVACGYSERLGFFTAMFVSNEMSGLPAFSLTMMGEQLVGAPDLNPSQQAEVVKMASETPMSDPAFLERHGVAIMEMMRLDMEGTVNMFHPDAAKCGSVVGGKCTLATVTKDGVTTRDLKRWDDAIGQRINPFSSSPNVSIFGSKARYLTVNENHDGRKVI